MSVTIKYNGSNVATVEGGKIATLPVENKKMVTDIIVTVPESKGEVLPDHTESDFTLQLANIASGELGVVYSSTEKVSFEAAPSGKVIDTFVDTNFLPSNIKKDVEIFGVTGEYGGGGGSADDRVKYVTYMDRGAELIKYPVIEGDTARDPVAKGYIEKPTKEPTASTVYPFGGWSKTDGGAPDSTALQNVTEDRTVYAAFAESVRTYTVNFYDGDTLVYTEQVAYGGSSSYEYEKDGYAFTGWSPEPTNITSDLDCYAQFVESLALEDTSWARISEISASGMAENFWAVGDTKSVAIKGNIGTTNTNNTYYVYIIGFDHNSEREGTGIHFGTFWKQESYGLNNVALVHVASDGRALTDGSKIFNFNHWGGESNYGGWGGCDLRYDILGSTDVAPSNYGKKAESGRTGYDATSTCATNPVENTLMAALPTDLRAVMKPMTKYTDCTGNVNSESAMAATIDYLPLLSEYEVFGKTTKGNYYESSYQKQYAYYSAGNSKLKGKHNSSVKYDSGGASIWWLRSPLKNNAYNFCFVSTTGSADSGNADYSRGIAPIFKV